MIRAVLLRPEMERAMAALPNVVTDRVEFLSEEDSRRLFDEIAQRYLGLSGEEFRRRWERGDYADTCELPEVMPVAILRRLAE
jgi:hypothetical protein